MTEYRPLYAKVRDALVDRLSAGDWPPGAMIPSEIALAGEFEVSQGTVRKAIDRLCADGALRRVQGRGTFVAEQTAESANFRFLRLVDETGARVVPALLRQVAGVRPATRDEARGLGLPAGAPVQVIQRTRTVGDIRAIAETIAVSPETMPDLIMGGPLPNALYPHYQAVYGISVLRTEETLAAAAASARLARRLTVPQATPLLRAVRVAFDLTGRAVEHRVSHFVTNGLGYSIELG